LIDERLRHVAVTEPDAVSFIDGDRRLTYGEWDWLSDRAAYSLAAEGVRAGDVVAILVAPGIAYPIAYAGAAKIGAVTAGINPRLSPREKSAVLEHSRARALVTDDADAPSPGILLTPEQLMRPGAAPPAATSDPDAPVAIVYTSGSTGSPKGATFTAGALEAVRRIEAAAEPLDHPRVLQAIPMQHMHFMTKIEAFIERRTTAVLMDRWTAAAALAAIAQHRLTTFGGVPAQLELMLMDPALEQTDLSSIARITIGGAPVTPALAGRVRRAFGVPVTVRYSCTELAVCTATAPDDPDEVVAHTVGRPLPEVDVQLLGVGDDGVGEVLARSLAMMRGYWPGRGDGLDEHGWFHTGDLGRVRADGRLQLVGRAKEMYIRGGYNVYPVEVEAALAEHPSIGLAAVFGIPDDVLGERGKAIVVCDEPLDEVAIRAFLAGRIADYKIPDVLEVRRELPLTPTGKVDKRALQQEAR